ncbi:MAG: carboxypeptidase-like regulatory domain-containing protein, partial [Bacteroidaceae bacterium]|nr:carboxypeptidase-like regulatory domain-containing protein [Bacteroidaceae bacterium]
MKKGFGMVGLWMFCSFSAWAQTVGLKGVVCDSLSGKAESYATVRLMQTGRTEPVTVSLTDSLGQFLMPVAKAGSYELVCSSIGKKSLTLKVAVGREVKDVGRLLLADEGNLLGTVRVKAQRPLVKAEIDKLSY